MKYKINIAKSTILIIGSSNFTVNQFLAHSPHTQVLPLQLLMTDAQAGETNKVLIIKIIMIAMPL